MSRQLKVGTGADCSVLIRMLHPSKLVNDTLTNREASERLVGLVALRKELKLVNRREQQCVVFRHDLFPNKELHCCMRYCKVHKEGDPVHFFTAQTDSPGSDEVEVSSATVEESRELPNDFENLIGSNEDIMYVQNLGFDVDDDDSPAPENVPGTTSTSAPDEVTSSAGRPVMDTICTVVEQIWLYISLKAGMHAEPKFFDGHIFPCAKCYACK